MVAFRASRLVWLAMLEIKATTSPMRDALSARTRTRSEVRRALSTAPAAAADVWDTWRADLVGRRREFLGRRRDGLNVHGGLVGRVHHGGGLPVGLVGGGGHGPGGEFHLGGRAGQGADHLADASLEAIRQGAHLGMATLARDTGGLILLDPQLRRLFHRCREDPHAGPDLADLVASGLRLGKGEVTLGQVADRGGDAGQGPGDRTPLRRSRR